MEVIRDKQQYASYIESRFDVPIFNKPFWLDAVCGKNNWHVVIVIQNDEIIAAIPYYTKKKFLFEIITTPKHTQRFSPCITYPKKIKTYSHKIDFENKLLKVLLDAFPKKFFFQKSFHFDYENILPLLWASYWVRYRHTYVIDDISSTGQVFKNFSNNRRRVIKRAQKSLTIKDNLKANAFYNFHLTSLQQRDKVISYSAEHFKEIYNACEKNKCGKIFSAVDVDGNLHAALFFIWDNGAAYHLVPIVSPKFYKSQAISLLVFHAIKFLKYKTKSYDFEGSMLPNVEKAYREYGALPKKYYHISTSNCFLIKHLLCLKGCSS
jgi:lipid II:glycine glycyltransferase (peptidoglycan interpeptide bridge formation enzyme)